MRKVLEFELLCGIRSVASVFGDHRYRLSVLLGCLMFSVQPGKSDTIVINDLSDVITVTDVGGSDTITLFCPTPEQCEIDISKPGPARIDLAPRIFMNLLEPVDHRVSDEINGD